MARPLSTPARRLHMKSTLSLHSFIFSYCATVFLLPIVAQAKDRLVLNICLISRYCINRIKLPIKLHNSIVYRLAILDFKKTTICMNLSIFTIPINRCVGYDLLSVNRCVV